MAKNRRERPERPPTESTPESAPDTSECTLLRRIELIESLTEGLLALALGGEPVVGRSSS
jgi:hypothetical protein